MSCLLPQFKCQPATFSIPFRTTPHSNSSKFREPVLFRAQCVLLTTTPSTGTSTVLSIEKLRLQSLEPLDSSTIQTPWMYLGAVDPPTTENFEATLDSEKLMNSEEATIAAASAEALALAKSAANFAKDAAFFANSLSFKGSQIVESEQVFEIGDFLGDVRTEEVDSLRYAEELSKDIAVRSIRQRERKAKRVRAMEKAASGGVLVKPGSSTSRKTRNALNDVDYSDPLHYIRATTTASKLLSASEELELSEGIQDMLKLERLRDELAERCGSEPTFSQWAAAARVDRRTLRKRINNGIYCKDRMIKSNIRLVISIAKNYQGAGMNLQDLVQEGCRGLIRGVEKFDASKGFKFSTYAHWWIKESLRKSLSDQSRTIRLPFHMVEASYKVKEARKKLYSENGRFPGDEELAEAAGISMKRLSAVLLSPKAPRSLDQKIGINQNIRPSDVISDPEGESSEERLIKQFMKQDLEKLLDNLNPRERQIIQWRYGMEDGRMKTLQEIGEIMGVSRERIRQIELSGFRKLKNKKRTANLHQYLIS